MSFIVKNTTFPTFFDLIAPHTCRGCETLGSPLCHCCKKNILSHRQNICPLCKQPSPSGNCPHCPDLPPTFVVGQRSDILDTIIQDFKYHSVRALARPLAEIIHQSLPEIPGPVVIIPLPTITRHVRERGLDHTYLIAKNLARLRGSNYHVEKLLSRHKNTVQVGSDSQTRRLQATEAYSLHPNFSPSSNTTYILLDDVWTTGSSMLSALQKFRDADTKNLCLAIIAASHS